MSRQQRQTSIVRNQTRQIRAVLIDGPRYDATEFVPLMKVAYGNAEPDR
jgi:hypothetical protein